MNRHTIVIGLGNPILSDDGVGVRVAESVSRLLEDSRSKVSVVEASVGGLRLVEMLEGYDNAVLIDALVDDTGAPPGTIYEWSLDDLAAKSPTRHIASAHDTTLHTALACGSRLGMELPVDITLFAISVRNVTDFGERLTPAVEASIPIAASKVVAHVQRDIKS